MERTGKAIAGTVMSAPGSTRQRRVGLLVLVGAGLLGGCVVVPARQAYVEPAPAYVAPGPVYVAPAPVYVAPAPVYGWGGYRWRRYGRW
jgi:hypothetical protein